jgi:GT2 family glycosyltransferase
VKLSIIIPTFNRQHVIGRAIESVLAQTYLIDHLDWELIVVDDGSTDSTQQWLGQAYPELIYIKSVNRGVSAARNIGIGQATGEWLALIDSDDEWLPHKLRCQFELLERTRLKVCHTEEIWIRDGVRVNQMKKHRKEGGWIFERCLPLCAMSPSSIVFHRDVLESVGLFDETLPACEDYDLWLKITSQYEVAYVEQACINKYGGHDDQLSRQHWGMDRFRVIALENFISATIDGPDCNTLYIELARKMLLKKLDILLKGAMKHDNMELAERCRASLVKFG